MPRPRTTKGLAKRIELTYYRRWHPFRRSWRILCWVGPAAAVAWLLVMAVKGDQRIYTSGPVAIAHRMFETDCERCHVDVPRTALVAATADGVASAQKAALPDGRRRGWFFRRVSDGACLACHDGALHQETQTSEPLCGTCHQEHEGRTALARPGDRHCTACHADLQTRAGTPRFERRVVSLAEHPEFALFRKTIEDRGAIKFGHAVHLKKDLPAGGGKRVTLGCVGCHAEDSAGRYILPINYEKHCQECHPLEAGPDLVVPHERPEIVRGYLLATLRGKAAPGAPAAAPTSPAPEPRPTEEEPGGRPGRRRGGAGAARGEFDLWAVSWKEVLPRVLLTQRRRGGAAEEPTEPSGEEGAPAGRRQPGTGAPSTETVPGTGAGTVRAGDQAIAQAERTLFFGRQGCPYCHTVERGEDLPNIVSPKIPDRWLPHSVFDHRSHRPLACIACHSGARESMETSDVLLPKVALCRECHREPAGAGTICVECHRYHDRARERAPDGPLSVPQFISGSAAAPPSTAR